MKVINLRDILVLRLDTKPPLWISMLIFLFRHVLIGYSLKNLMYTIQTFVGPLLKVCYIYQATRCGVVFS